MNIIRNLKVDLDRIELFSDMGYEYNVDEYKDSMVMMNILQKEKSMSVQEHIQDMKVQS